MRAVLLLLLLTGSALAFDRGQYGDVPPNVRAWFKGIHSPGGGLCCDMADGHRTTWERGQKTQYAVPIDGMMVDVPDEAIVANAGNPTGEAVVWYSKWGSQLYIRCFVPGGGV